MTGHNKPFNISLDFVQVLSEKKVCYCYYGYTPPILALPSVPLLTASFTCLRAAQYSKKILSPLKWWAERRVEIAKNIYNKLRIGVTMKSVAYFAHVHFRFRLQLSVMYIHSLRFCSAPFFHAPFLFFYFCILWFITWQLSLQIGWSSAWA